MKTPRPWDLPGQPATRAQLLSQNVTDRMLRTAVTNGRLLRLRGSVYVAADAWPDDPADQHLMLARTELVTHPGAVISHASAGVLWRLPSPSRDWHQQPPTVTLPSGSSYRPGQRHVAYRTVNLPPQHVTVDHLGYDVTTIARTAVDLARGEELPQALVVLDAAARLLVASVVRQPRRVHYASGFLIQDARQSLSAVASGKGVAALRTAIALTDPRRETPIESLSAGHFHLAGLPVPEYQHPIRTSLGWYVADFYWKRSRLIGEADGAVKYLDPQEILREKAREQDLDDHGHRFVRWTGKEIWWTPEVVVARVARKLTS